MKKIIPLFIFAIFVSTVYPQVSNKEDAVKFDINSIKGESSSERYMDFVRKYVYKPVKSEELIEQIKNSIDKYPDNPELYLFLSRCIGRKYFEIKSNLIPDTMGMRKDFSTSINYLKKAVKVDPDYEFAYLRLGRDYGSMAFMPLRLGCFSYDKYYFQKAKEEGGFFPIHIEMAKNYLITCEPNSILFTNGDDDTFPLLYLQLCEGFRTDVRVVNLSLLNTSFFIKFIKYTNPDIVIKYSDEEIENMKQVKWEKTKEVSINFKERGEEKTLKIEVEPTLKGKVGGIRVQDQMVLHIIKNNIEKIPIYFAITTPDINKVGLKQYLSLEGFAYRVISEKDREINPEKLYSNLLSNYSFKETMNPNAKGRKVFNPLIQNYRTCFMQILYHFYMEKNFTKTKFVLEQMDKLIPENLYPFRSEKIKQRIYEIRKEIELKE